MVGCGAWPADATSAPPAEPRRCWRRGTRRGLRGRRPAALLRVQVGVLRLEGVGDVLEEDQAEDDVLVLGRVHVVAQGVRLPHSFDSKPKGGPFAKRTPRRSPGKKGDYRIRRRTAETETKDSPVGGIEGDGLSSDFEVLWITSIH